MSASLGLGDSKIICVIGDEDTVTGFLLAGIGQRDAHGANFLVVDASASPFSPLPRPVARARCARRRLAHLACLLALAHAETPRDTLERTFKAMLARDDCGLLLINQPIADAIRPVVNAHRAIIPMVLEIPSKDVAYDAKKDPLMKRVLQMLGEDV